MNHKTYTKKQLNAHRSNMRQCFKNLNIVNEYKRSLMYKLIPYRAKKFILGAVCAKCKLKYKSGNLELDHIKECGKIKDGNDLLKFYNNLFCDLEENIQLLCKRCHGIKSYQYKADVNIDIATSKKWAIRIMKDKILTKIIIDIRGKSATNDTQRRKQLIEIYKTMMNEVEEVIEDAVTELKMGRNYEFYEEVLDPNDFSTSSLWLLEEEVRSTLTRIVEDANDY